jgi:hypothetical protein
VRVISVRCTRIGVELLRRRFASGTCYIACVLCQLAAPGLEWNSSGGVTQAALVILRVCYVSWLHQDWSGTLKHYLLILRRRSTTGTWYSACVLCQLAAPGLEFHSNPGAASTCFEHYLLILRKRCTSGTCYIVCVCTSEAN